jgi:hypothetical protein
MNEHKTFPQEKPEIPDEPKKPEINQPSDPKQPAIPQEDNPQMPNEMPQQSPAPAENPGTAPNGPK